MMGKQNSLSESAALPLVTEGPGAQVPGLGSSENLWKRGVIKLSNGGNSEAFLKSIGQKGGFSITWEIEKARIMRLGLAHAIAYRLKSDVSIVKACTTLTVVEVVA